MNTENISNQEKNNGVLADIMHRLFNFCYQFAEKYHEVPNGDYTSDNKEFKIKKHNYTQKMYSPARIHTPTETIEVLDNLNLDTVTLTFIMLDVWLIHYYRGDYLQADKKAMDIMISFHDFSKIELIKNITTELSKVQSELNVNRCRSFIGA